MFPLKLVATESPNVLSNYYVFWLKMVEFTNVSHSLITKRKCIWYQKSNFSILRTRLDISKHGFTLCRYDNHYFSARFNLKWHRNVNECTKIYLYLCISCHKHLHKKSVHCCTHTKTFPALQMAPASLAHLPLPPQTSPWNTCRRITKMTVLDVAFVYYCFKEELLSCI